MRNDKYVRIIHRRRVLQELQATLRDRYISTPDSPKPPLICEEAPLLDREVSLEALLEVAAWIDVLEREENKQLERFELRERNDESILEVLKKEEKPSPKEKHGKKKERKARPKSSGEEAPQSGASDQPTGETPPES